MKRILLSVMLALSLPIGQSMFAQKSITHFDSKPYVQGEMLIQLKANQSLKGLINKLPASYEVKLNRLLSKPMRVYLVSFNPNTISHEAFQSLMYQQQEVSLVDYNYEIQMRSTIPNDADFTDQWHHNNTGQTGGTVDADIDSDLAWDITTGGLTATNDDIVVCLIESGNLDHNDITANRWFNANEIPNNNIDDDGNGYIDDYNGWNPLTNDDDYGTGAHGTNCLGMIGADGNNGNLVAGANWNVKLMVVGGYSISNQANAIEAYTYPLEMRQIWNNTNGSSGAFVVATSSSWGIDGADPTQYPIWCSFYDTLGKYGVLNVGATTNSNLNVDTQGDMPTACGSNYMIGVGRTDHNDNTAGGYGATTIEFGAPGINVVTTANTNTITTTTGTSFSCPLTAGVIGLAYSIPCPSFMALVKNDPQLGADVVLQALLDGTDAKAALASKFITGGRLNSKNTLDELMAVTCSGTICLAPGSVNYSNLSGVGTDITWNSSPSATAYDLYYKELAAGTWTQVQVTGSSYSLTGLQPCTEYEFYMQSICGSDSSNNSGTQTFRTTGCGNCVDLPYCTTSAGSGDEHIESVEIGPLNNVSGNNGGYGDFTNGSVASTSFTEGVTYSLTLTPGWSGAQYDEYFRVWIDLDQNGTFDAAEMLYDQGAAGTTPAIGNITIPNGTIPGSTRMRVQMAYLGTGQNTLPANCGTYTYGEIEDYCVEIVQAQICGFSVTNTVVEPSCAGVDNGSIDVTVSGGTPGYTYDWSPNGETTSNISGLAPGIYDIEVTDNAGCDTTMSYTLAYTTTVSVIVTSTAASCNGVADGSLLAAGADGTAPFSYVWSNAVTTANNDNVAAGSYSVDVTDANGCMATGNGTVNEPAAVQASFSSSLTNTTVNFTNTSSTGTYLWDFGDGNTSTVTNPTHTYSDYGTYNVCLTVTNSCGTDNSCKMVDVMNSSTVTETENSFLNYYPNPATEKLFITNIPANVASIVLVDISGKVINTFGINNTQLNIELNDLSQGVYLLLVKDASGQVLATDKFNKIK